VFQYDQPLGRMIRLPLRAIPREAALPILSGPNRGLRWIAGAGTHACWLGRYERQEIEWFLSRLSPASVVWDIGAHAGYFAMACARRCREVVACEALPENAANLLRHIRLNNLENVSVVRFAIGAEASGTVTFGGSTSSYQNQIGSGSLSVPLTSIDALVSAGHQPPSIIKMDIEGAEVAALRGGRATLTTHKPNILVAVHSAELSLQCRSFLESLGYTVTGLNVATLWAAARTR
jgi:FkbM family methyltransferase